MSRERRPKRIGVPKRWKTLRFLSAPEVAFDFGKKIEKSFNLVAILQLHFLGNLLFLIVFKSSSHRFDVKLRRGKGRGGGEGDGKAINTMKHVECR